MPGATASRYDTLMKLAQGGMATVWIGAVRGALGFRQLVAIKKPHPHLMSDPTFRSELIAEARLASMIHHANVVDVRDVEIDGDSISLVMDYIEGASLGDLIVAAADGKTLVPARACVRICLDALAGLHAAHDLVDERGRAVGLVHRDISPQNILVGMDGIARVTDFGVAKFARKGAPSTSEGSLKGKLAYMAPEYLMGEAIDRRFDVFAMGVVLWEALAAERCFRRNNEAETLHALINHTPRPISEMVPGLGTGLDAILKKALSKNRNDRFQSAQEMAIALEEAATLSSLLGKPSEVAEAVRALTGNAIEERRSSVRQKLASEPSMVSLLDASPVPDKTIPMPPIELSTTKPLPLAARGPVRTLPLANQVAPAHHQAVADSSEYVSDLSAIGIPNRRRSIWPLVLGALLLLGLVVAIVIPRIRPTPSAAAETTSPTLPTATELPTASTIPFATAVATQAPVTPPAAASVPPRPAPVRPSPRTTTPGRRPPPNPYQDP